MNEGKEKPETYPPVSLLDKIGVVQICKLDPDSRCHSIAHRDMVCDLLERCQVNPDSAIPFPIILSYFEPAKGGFPDSDLFVRPVQFLC